MKETPLKINIYGSPVLRKKAKDVEIIDQRVRDTLEEMLQLMYEHQGIGLAANQVGLLERMIVIDLGQNPLKLINPRIIKKKKGKVEFEEGCLSLPGTLVRVRRFNDIVVEALDTEGRPLEIKAQGLLSVCLQHEIDHLDGRLLIDYLPWRARLKEKRRLLEVFKSGGMPQPTKESEVL